VNDKAPDMNDLAGLHGIDYVRDHFDTNGHRFNGKLSDSWTAGETPYKPLIVHEAEDLLSQPRPELTTLRVAATKVLALDRIGRRKKRRRLARADEATNAETDQNAHAE
jgi:hypothetical protein